ncbi:glycosyltransferase [Dyella japonica]|uniref:Glycosyltransferase involved in cell wall biosynthesis n=1 Tax=Dyella japonica TaxID=231455 RepID=A0ABV2JW76_9GAMM
MSQVLISVCVLTCNQSAYIEACLQSILAQATDVSLEVLVGDDASDDETSQIVSGFVQKYPAMIKHFRHEVRLGASRNYQAILAHVSGEYVAHLDGDDYWLPGKLKKQVEFLEAHSECSAVYCNARTVSEDGAAIGLFNDVGNAQFSLSDMLSRGNFLNTSSMVFRASLCDAIIQIEDAFIDFRIHLRHARRGVLAHMADAMVGYRVNASGSMMANSNALVRQLYWEAILDGIGAGVSDELASRALADFTRRVFFRSLRFGQWSLMREWMPRIRERVPYSGGRFFLLVMASIVRTVIRELYGRASSLIGEGRPAVLYRR